MSCKLEQATPNVNSTNEAVIAETMGSLGAEKSEAPSRNPQDDGSTGNSWKHAVDQKLHRLHSLLFGSEMALEKDDAETALGFSLRLLGFLESECRNAEDRAYIAPIKKQAREKIDAAREKMTTSGDRYAFEQAKCKESFIFAKTGSVNIDSIKRSQYYVPFMGSDSQLAKRLQLQTCPSRSYMASLQSPVLTSGHQTTLEGNKVMEPSCLNADYDEGISFKQSRGLTQTKITAMYCNKLPKSPDHLARLQTGAVQFSSAHSHHSRAWSPQDSRPVNRSKSASVTHVSSPIQFDSEEERTLECGIKRKRHQYVDETSQVPEKARLPINNECNEDDAKITGFVTAKQKWAMDSLQKRGTAVTSTPPASPGLSASSYQIGVTQRSGGLKSLGMCRRGIRGNFVPPIKSNGTGAGAATVPRPPPSCLDNGLDDSARKCLELLAGPDGELPDKLRNLEPRLIEHVSNEIMDQDPNVRWDDIAGLEHAKKCVTEMVIWPLLRPDIFQGCRSPGKGLLLFGPPGTGKTMIGKAIAGEAKATFFYISASSLTSKWIGEGEKLVRALFGVASCRQPAVIFVDEIDSLLSQRKSEGEHESSRRLKTQFLIEMEGFGSGTDQLLLIGATNRPQELDEAARRRLSKRLYIPLPSAGARARIVRNLLKKDGLFTLSDDDIDAICVHTEGYSGSDMSNLVKEASMGPLREVLMQGIDISELKKEEMRPVMLQDFVSAVQHVKPSVSPDELGTYESWNSQFGSHAL